jgi:flagellar FliL protein
MGMLGGAQQSSHVAFDAPAIYHPLEPPFIVNFKDRGRNRFLQVEVQVMTRDPKMIEHLNKHMPVIRNNLLLLFGSQTADGLQSTEGREKLRKAALEEIQKILNRETGHKGVEELYFTSFVMQ